MFYRAFDVFTRQYHVFCREHCLGGLRLAQFAEALNTRRRNTVWMNFNRDFRFGPPARVHRTPLLPSTQRNLSLEQAPAKVAGSDG